MGGAAFVDEVFKYDMLDNLLETVEEAANGAAAEFLRTRYRYDANENRALVIEPEGNATANVGYDGLRRVVQLRHLRADNSVVVGFLDTYDRMNNKLSEGKLHAVNDSELYRYDSSYCLLQLQRGGDQLR